MSKVTLLKNKTRQRRTYNVGDRGVKVVRQEAAVSKHGQAGVRTKSVAVSTSISLMSGEMKQVPNIILKQRAVQRDIAKGILLVVQQDSGDSKEPAQPAITIDSTDKVKERKGSHPVEEEGSVNIQEFKKAQK